METVGFNSSHIFEIWVDIKGRWGVGMVVLQVYTDDIECNVNVSQKGFVWLHMADL